MEVGVGVGVQREHRGVVRWGELGSGMDDLDDYLTQLDASDGQAAREAEVG
jgi:hypothetical protein